MNRVSSIGLAVALLGLAVADARAQTADPPLKELPPAANCGGTPPI